MDEFIRRMVGFAQSFGEIKNGSITEATNYYPKAIKMEGVTKTGDKFSLELTMGDKNEDT